MAAKQAKQQKAAKEKTNVVAGLRTFFVEVGAEMKKIVWPTREVLIQSTVAVTAMVLALTIYMGIMDLVLRKLYNLFDTI